ncbi:unnamed protein product [Strongylus vulgaris]|uniref:SCP domain-containing protein n=1 Tax=Strongylus vulgaris TaxID=40348 RepID=A0A3P7LIT3_STRVU|nr:unnamed protein product [Strongylus vulgaris]
MELQLADDVRELASGTVEGINGLFPAGEIPDVTWDCDLEEKAWKSMQGGRVDLNFIWPHAASADMKSLPLDNIRPVSFEVDFKPTLEKWWREGFINMNPDKLYNRADIEDFANMMNAKNLKIGCYTERTKRQCLAMNVCFYGVSPKWDEPVY